MLNVNEKCLTAAQRRCDKVVENESCGDISFRRCGKVVVWRCHNVNVTRILTNVA